MDGVLKSFVNASNELIIGNVHTAEATFKVAILMAQTKISKGNRRTLT